MMFAKIVSMFSVTYMGFFILLWLALSLMGYEEALPASYVATFFCATLSVICLRRWWLMRDNKRNMNEQPLLPEGNKA